MVMTIFDLTVGTHTVTVGGGGVLAALLGSSKPREGTHTVGW